MIGMPVDTHQQLAMASTMARLSSLLMMGKHHALPKHPLLLPTGCWEHGPSCFCGI
jgi:hypothetical protein